jgi:TPR repeat protein
MCFLGEGLPRDTPEALKWLRLASAQGSAGAQGCLGMMSALGDGVPRDTVEAYALLLRAGAGGNEQAGRTAQLVKGGLTAAQIEEARVKAEQSLRF